MVNIKLIVNADDLGLTKGVNLGIIEAHKNGIVTSSTLMANMPQCEHALNLIKDNPGLGVGVHLVLTAGKPISSNVPSLVNEDGNFRNINGIIQFGQLDDIKKEFISQIERFYSFGLEPTHIDSHHHVHGLDTIAPIVQELSIKYGIPIRNVNNKINNSININRINTSIKTSGIISTEYFSDEFYGENLSIEYLENILNKTFQYKSVEIMCHPAYVDYELYTKSSYNRDRAYELFVLTSLRVKSFLKNKGIQLINYMEI